MTGNKLSALGNGALIITLIYAVGVGLSQSLMSLGGSFFALFALLSLLPKSFSLFKREKTTFYLGLGLVAFLYIHLLLLPADRTFADASGIIPLLLVPLGGYYLADTLKKLEPIKLQKYLKTLIIISGICASFSSLLALYQILISGHPGVALFHNPIYLAYNLFPAFIFFCELIRLKGANHMMLVPKSWLIFFAVATALGILASLNRMIPMAMGLYLLLRFIGPFLFQQFSGRGKSFPWKTWLLFGAFGVLAVVLLYVRSPDLREKLFRPHNEDLSYIWRLKAWQFNWNLFVQHPFFGVGTLRNWIDTAVQTELAGHWEPNHRIYAHSIYLQMLAEGGLVGFLLFVSYWISIARQSSLLLNLVLFDLFIAGVTENITVNSKPFHALLFYSMLGIVISKTLTITHSDTKSATAT